MTLLDVLGLRNIFMMEIMLRGIFQMSLLLGISLRGVLSEGGNWLLKHMLRL